MTEVIATIKTISLLTIAIKDIGENDEGAGDNDKNVLVLVTCIMEDYGESQNGKDVDGHPTTEESRRETG